jgi:hypothetical protein
MGYSDFSPSASRILIGLWCWQCLDITLHAIANLVTVPHTLANCVWWIGVPAILLNMKPPEARYAIMGCNVLYWCFIIWFIVVYLAGLDTKDATVFWTLITISQILAGLGAYFAGHVHKSGDPLIDSTLQLSFSDNNNA